MPTREAVKPRGELLDRLFKAGLEGFVTHHINELTLVPHTKEVCALPGYAFHLNDEPKEGGNPTSYTNWREGGMDREENVNMTCGLPQRDLCKMLEMGESNPLVVYFSLERAMNDSPHVKLAVLPSHPYITYRGGEMVSGSVGDVIVYLKPYGRRAEDLRQHVENSPFFKHGKCVGYFRITVGLDESNDSVLYIDELQTDGNRRIRLSAEDTLHSLPGGLRKLYMDGGPSVKAWYDEGLSVIEAVANSVGIPIAIPTWEEVITYAERPEKLTDSSSAKRIYQSPEKRGYELSRVRLQFPQKTLYPSGLTMRQVNVWLKR